MLDNTCIYIYIYTCMAMGENLNRTPGEHPNPTTKIGAKMEGEFTENPKMGSH